MKTVKLQIVGSPNLYDDIRVYSSAVRMAFNRYQDGLSEKEVYAAVSKFFDFNCWLVQSAVYDGNALFKSNGNKRVLFGGKYSLVQYLKGLITKEQFKYARMLPLCSVGQANKRGNRLVDFDLCRNQVIYKPSRKEHKKNQILPRKEETSHRVSQGSRTCRPKEDARDSQVHG